MANIFSGTGRIAVIPNDDDSVPFGMIVGDFQTSMSIKGILGSVQMAGQGGIQMMHTLRRAIYMYTFGERVGELEIGGLLMHADCSDRSIQTQQSGVLRFFDWYERNRVTTTGLPVTITVVPGLVLTGFLFRMKFGVSDPSLPIAQFSASFMYPPRIIAANAKAVIKSAKKNNTSTIVFTIKFTG
jgi:hypothetical protein